MEETCNPAMARSGMRGFPAFPFEPYPIQLDFMNALYNALDQGGVAMLESPTGTGKTLSIICSALQWLVDQRQKPKARESSKMSGNVAGAGVEEEEPDWMREFVAEPENRPVLSKTKTKLDKASKIKGFRSSNQKKDAQVQHEVVDLKNEQREDNDEDVEFLVDEYESGEEERRGARSRGKSKRKEWLSSGSSSSSSDEEKEEQVVPKVYFCSRTHSQLSQFVKEFKRTSFTSEINLVSLGSRKNLCINSEVLKLGSSYRINEKCLELQKNKSRKDAKTKTSSDRGRKKEKTLSCGCPMLRKRNLNRLLQDEGRQEAMDIEDLVQLGKKIGTCPYYGSRGMVSAAQLVILPYQSLFQKSARDSLALDLRNSIVIIDEAHNLADSLTSMHNSKITLSQVYSHLEVYLSRFQSCLGAGNRRYIQTLMVLTKSFIQILLEDRCDTSFDKNKVTEEMPSESSTTITSMTINEFLFALDIDNINLVKLRQYIKESNIIHKVSGYGTKKAATEGTSLQFDGRALSSEGSFISGFQALADILISLTTDDPDGRIIISRRPGIHPEQLQEGNIKFVMLSGDKLFSEILNEAHAVVLTGGTLQPIEETRVRLFPELPSNMLHFFSCSHIVPPESVLPIVISRGPSNSVFDFSYSSRNVSSMVEELGRLVCNLVNVVPEGMIVFFSSFEYERQVYDAWKNSGIIERILRKKKIFREPKDSTDVDHILTEYKQIISLCTRNLTDTGTHGALLLAVVGGKVSEGINFSDGMGRCVVMVGLPYPSPSDIELMERIKHIDWLGDPSSSRKLDKPVSSVLSTNNDIQSGFDVLRSCRQRGKDYYENLCMKAVNQSIGRAIRHINDYAAILLVDSRYISRPSKTGSIPTDKLPLWIKDRLVCAENYGQVHKLLHKFFCFNKQKNNLA